jgi:hypothetical protein
MSTGHSKLGPSKAEQWVNCLRSVSFIEENEHRLPPDEGSVYAAEGTRAHEVAAASLTAFLADPSRCQHDIPQDLMEGGLEHYVSDCLAVTRTPGDTYIEERVPLWYKPEDGGTVDFAHVSDDRVTIRDLKWGMGEFVNHEENLQLAIYAMSLVVYLRETGLYAFRPDTVVDIGICQPRYRGEEKLRTWVLSLAELETFCAEIAKSADYILSCAQEYDSSNLPFTPTEKGCRWCRAKSICPARNAALDEGLPVPLAQDDALALLPEVEVSALSDEQITRILAAAPFIEDIIKDARAFAFERASVGTPLPGTKLVQGRAGNRAWADESEAEKVLVAAKLSADQRYEKKVISVAKAEKLLAPLAKTRPRVYKRFTDCITRAEGKPTLVLDTDPRPALDNSDIIKTLPDLTHE